jgi:hypothetical protein
MTLQYMLRKVPYAVSIPLGARGHGVGHLVMVTNYGKKALANRKILKVHLYKSAVSCNLTYSALHVKNRQTFEY